MDWGVFRKGRVLLHRRLEFRNQHVKIKEVSTINGRGWQVTSTLPCGFYIKIENVMLSYL